MISFHNVADNVDIMEAKFFIGVAPSMHKNYSTFTPSAISYISGKLPLKMVKELS